MTYNPLVENPHARTVMVSAIFDSQDAENHETLQMRWEGSPSEAERKSRIRSDRSTHESDLDDTQTAAGGKRHSRACARTAVVCAVFDSQDAENHETLQMRWEGSAREAERKRRIR
jgi:hypothetical protein